MNTNIYAPNPIYKIGAPNPVRLIQSSVAQLIEDKVEAARIKNQAARTPTVVTDPLLNLKVRDYYRQKYERSLATEVSGRIFGAAEGGLLGAGLGAAIGALIGSIVPGAGTVAGGALGAKIGAGVGAGTGLVTSDYTTHHATIDYINNTLVQSFKGGVGQGVLTTLTSVGKTMDLVEGGEAIRAAIYSLINGESIVENIGKAYGLDESGRTEMDFSKIRESMNMDLGGVGNTFFDMTGEILTDPGAVSALVVKPAFTKGATKNITESIQDLNKSMKFGINKSVTNTSFIKSLSKAVKENDEDLFVKIVSDNLNSANFSKNFKSVKAMNKGDKEVISEFYKAVRKDSLKKTSFKIWNEAKSLDDFDDYVTSILFKTHSGLLAVASTINKGVPALLNKLSSIYPSWNKIADAILGNQRANTITSAQLNKFVSYKQVRKYELSHNKLYSDLDDTQKALLKNNNIKNINQLKQFVLENPNNKKISNVLEFLKSKYQKEFDDALSKLSNTKDKSYIKKVTDSQKMLDSLNKDPYVNTFRKLYYNIQNFKKLTKDSDLNVKQQKYLQSLITEFEEYTSKNLDKLYKVMGSSDAELIEFYKYIRDKVSKEFKSSLEEFFKDSYSKFNNYVLKNSAKYRKTILNNIRKVADDKLLSKISEITNDFKDTSFETIQKVVNEVKSYETTKDITINYSNAFITEFEDTIRELSSRYHYSLNIGNYVNDTNYILKESFKQHIISPDESVVNSIIQKNMEDNLEKQINLINEIIPSIDKDPDYFKLKKHLQNLLNKLSSTEKSTSTTQRILKNLRTSFNDYYSNMYTYNYFNFMDDATKVNFTFDNVFSNPKVLERVEELNKQGFVSEDLYNKIRSIDKTKVKNIDFNLDDNVIDFIVSKNFVFDLTDYQVTQDNILKVLRDSYSKTLLTFRKELSKFLDPKIKEHYEEVIDLIDYANNKFLNAIKLRDEKFNKLQSELYKLKLELNKNPSDKIKTKIFNKENEIKKLNKDVFDSAEELSNRIYNANMFSIQESVRQIMSNNTNFKNFNNKVENTLDKFNEELNVFKTKHEYEYRIAKALDNGDNTIDGFDLDIAIHQLNLDKDFYSKFLNKNIDGLDNKTILTEVNNRIDYLEEEINLYTNLQNSSIDSISSMQNFINHNFIYNDNHVFVNSILKDIEYEIKKVVEYDMSVDLNNLTDIEKKLIKEQTLQYLPKLFKYASVIKNMDTYISKDNLNQIYYNILYELYNKIINVNLDSLKDIFDEYKKYLDAVHTADENIKLLNKTGYEIDYNDFEYKIIFNKEKNKKEFKINFNKNINCSDDYRKFMSDLISYKDPVSVINKYKYSDKKLFDIDLPNVKKLYAVNDTRSIEMFKLIDSFKDKTISVPQKASAYINKASKDLSSRNIEDETFVIFDTETYNKDKQMWSLAFRTIKYDKTKKQWYLSDFQEYYINPEIAKTWSKDVEIDSMNDGSTLNRLIKSSKNKRKFNSTKEMANEFKKYLDTLGDNKTIVAHNAEFDYDVLNISLEDQLGFKNYDVLDSLYLYQNYNIFKDLRGYKNINIAQANSSIGYTVIRNGETVSSIKGISKYEITEIQQDGKPTEYLLNGRPLHDADVDTDLQAYLFTKALKKFNNQDLSKLDNPELIEFKLDLDNNLEDKYISVLINDTLNVIKKYYTSDLDNHIIKNIYGTLFEFENNQNSIIKLYEELENIKLNDSLESEILDKVNKLYDKLDIKYNNFINEQQQLHKLYTNKYPVYRQYNRNYINMVVVQQYFSNDNLRILEKIVNGDAEGLSENHAQFANLFKMNEFKNHTFIKELRQLFSDLKESSVFYYDTIDYIFNNIKQPYLLDAFHNMINIAETKTGTDMLVNLEVYCANQAAVLSNLGIDTKYLVELKDTIIDKVKNSNGRILLQPTYNAQNIIYKSFNNTIMQVLRKKAETDDTYLQMYKGFQNLLYTSLEDMRNVLKNFKTANKQLALQPLAFSNISHGIKYGDDVIKASDLVRTNSLYTIKYGNEVKQSMVTKGYQYKIMENFGIKFKNKDLNAPKEIYTSLQEHSGLGKIFNLISSIVNRKPKEFLYEASLYNIEYTEFFDYLWNLFMENKLEVPELFNNKKLIEEFKGAMFNINEQNFGYIENIEDLKNMFKAQFIESVFFKYNDILGQEGFYKNVDDIYNKEYILNTIKSISYSSKQFNDFKKFYINQDGSVNLEGFKKFLNEHKEYVFVIANNNKIKRIDINNTEDSILLDLLTNNLYSENISLVDRDTFYKLSKRFDSNKIGDNKKIIKLYDINSDGSETVTVKKVSDLSYTELKELRKEYSSTKNKYYTMDDPFGVKMINAMKEFWLIPSKITSLFMSMPYMVNNIFTAFLNNMRQSGREFNVVDMAVKTGRNVSDLTKHARLFDAAGFNNEITLFNYCSEKGINWLKALKDKDIISKLKSFNPDISDEYLDQLGKAIRNIKDFNRLEKIERYLSSQAAYGESAELQENLKIHEARMKEIEGLDKNSEDYYIKNPKPNGEYKTFKEELIALKSKEASQRTAADYSRIRRLNSYINSQKYNNYYKIFNKGPVKKWNNINNFIENAVRITLIDDLIEQGYTEAASLSKTIDTHFLYTNKSVAEQYAEFVVPFISYPIRAVQQLDELTSDYSFIKMMYLWDKTMWSEEDEDSKKSDFLTKRRARGDIPVGDKLLQVGNPFLETMTNIGSPLYALNNKLNPFIKPFVDLATDAKYNRWNQLPGVGQATNLYNIIKERNVLATFTNDYYQYGTYVPRYINNKYPKFYNKLYTYTGYSRVLMNMQNVNSNNLKYRVNQILRYS